MAWTDEAKSLCRQLWERNLSAGQIVMRLAAAGHGNFTRNAVVGILHRMKVPNRGKRETAPKAPPKPKPRPPKPIVDDVPPLAPSFSVEEALARMTITPTAERVEFLDLQEHHCRAPSTESDGRKTFCGRNKAGEGVSYCLEHCRLFYQPREAVRRRYG